MKKHYGYIDELMLEDMIAGTPRIDGNVIEIPVIKDLEVFSNHPMVTDGFGFHVDDGFILRFEGVVRSKRNYYRMTEISDDPAEDWTIEDGPFPPADGPVDEFHDLLFGSEEIPGGYVNWNIDAEKFCLIEPEGNWKKHRRSSEHRGLF